jgi:hypothetical protein
MKPYRSILALLGAFAFAFSLAFAESPVAEKPAAKPEKAPCGCAVKVEGKVCGIDTTCCCTGEKAKGRTEEKKPEGGTPSASTEGSAKAACPPCDACKA